MRYIKNDFRYSFLTVRLLKGHFLGEQRESGTGRAISRSPTFTLNILNISVLSAKRNSKPTFQYMKTLLNGFSVCSKNKSHSSIFVYVYVYWKGAVEHTHKRKIFRLCHRNEKGREPL